MESLEQARKICQKNGQKFTPIRASVLEILMNAAQPMSAYNILDKYRDATKPGAQPPTIYRALAFLEDNGLIHRMASTRQFVVCEHIGEHCSHDMTQFFICDNCGTVEEALISHDLQHQIQQNAETLNFKVQQPSLEIHGICKDCQ